jgi:hypothetical protein
MGRKDRQLAHSGEIHIDRYDSSKGIGDVNWGGVEKEKRFISDELCAYIVLTVII